MNYMNNAIILNNNNFKISSSKNANINNSNINLNNSGNYNSVNNEKNSPQKKKRESMMKPL